MLAKKERASIDVHRFHYLGLGGAILQAFQGFLCWMKRDLVHFLFKNTFWSTWSCSNPIKLTDAQHTTRPSTKFSKQSLKEKSWYIFTTFGFHEIEIVWYSQTVKLPCDQPRRPCELKSKRDRWGASSHFYWWEFFQLINLN